MFHAARLLLDLLIEEVDVAQDRADPQGVMAIKTALQRLSERGDLAPQGALGQFGQHLRVGGSGDQRVQRRAPGDAEDVRGHAVELDRRCTWPLWRRWGWEPLRLGANSGPNSLPGTAIRPSATAG